MIRLLQFLLHGCWHVWETHATVEVLDKERFGDTPWAFEKQCQCTKCGQWKAFRL